MYLSVQLQALPMDESAVQARGIRRARDKITLPPSIGADLMSQDAPKNGAMFFEIKTPGGSRMHSGLLEFTAPEGVVLLPRSVVQCLWGLDGSCQGRVTVTYRRLDKGTFVR